MIWQALYNGVVTGALYALVALGYTLIYGVARLINFAHGDVMMVGAYTCLFCMERFHLPPAPALLAAIAAGALIALLIERLAVRPAARKGDRLAPVISTIGASVVLQAGAGLLFGAAARSLPGGKLLDPIYLGPIQTTLAQLSTLVGGSVLTLVLALFLKFHLYGQAIRAVADDPTLAETVGIAPHRIAQIAFALSGIMAALAGIAVGLDSSLRPTMGYSLGFMGFTAAVLGGIGNPTGAILGAMLVGMVSSLTGTYLSSAWLPGYVFGTLALLLLFRPQGLLPGRKAVAT